MKPSPKVDLARRLAQDLMAQPHALAVLVVGSVATGLDSEDSDLDLAVLLDREGEISEEFQQHGKVRVGIERYPVRLFRDLPPVPVYDLEGLRNAGRFARGVVLESRWPGLAAVQAAWRNARLDPAEADELLDLAAAYLEPMPAEVSPADHCFKIQGAATALAMLTLALEPCRFQKPKWLLHDLVATGHQALAEQIQLVFMNQMADARHAAQTLEAAQQQLDAACKLAGDPPLSFDPAQGERRVYVHQTYRDAVSLHHDGDFAGAIFTALYALRLLHALLQAAPEDVAWKSDGALARWRAHSLAAVMPGGIPTRATLEHASHALAEVAHALQERYRG